MKLSFGPRFECVGIALIVTLLLTSTFDQYSYTYDQLRNLVVSDEILERGIPTYFGYNFYKHPPLLYYLIALLSLSGISLHTSGQIIVLVFAFFSIIFTYKLGNELFDKNFARVSSILLGVTPSFWVWGNRIMHETMIYFFFPATLYFFLLGIRRERTGDWICFGLLLGLGLLAKVVMLLIIPIAIIFSLSSPRVVRFGKRVSYVNLGLIKKAMLSLFLAFLVYSPYLIYKVINHGPGIFEIWSKHVRGDIPWAKEIVHTPFYYYISNLHLTLSFLLTILFAVGLVFLILRKEKRLLLPLIWFLIIITFFSLPAYKEARLINSLLPAAVFIGTYAIFELSRILGKFAGIKPLRILPVIFIPILAIQAFSSLSIVMNDGHWPADWKMWEYLRELKDDGGVIVSDYDYVAIRYFTGKHSEILPWGIPEHDILDGMMESSIYYIYRNDRSVPREYFQKVKEFDECNCSLYRIRDEMMENVTILKVYSGGKPLEGVIIRVFDQNGEVVYKVRSNRKGEAFLPLKDGYYYLTAEKICYGRTEAYVEIREKEVYECELISKVTIPFVVKCYGNEYEMNLEKRGCLFHGFTEARF